MKKLVFVTGVILIGCVIISALAAPSPAPAADAPTVISQSEEKHFIVKAEEGRLVVYRKGEDSPFMTTETFVYTLPKSDKLQLEKGVEVTGNTALRKTLEDFCS